MESIRSRRRPAVGVLDVYHITLAASEIRVLPNQVIGRLSRFQAVANTAPGFVALGLVLCCPGIPRVRTPGCPVTDRMNPNWLRFRVRRTPCSLEPEETDS